MSADTVVLVTGASGGVGRGIALACGQAGWTVWIAARRADAAAAVADEVDRAGGHGRSIVCDVADPGSVRAAVAAVVERDGRLDGVVHNATSGLSPVPSVLATLSAADLHSHVSVSLRGTYLLAVAARPHLAASRGAYVVLTSEAGFEGKAKLPAYAAVKAAQRGLARTLAREWGADGIRVNCLAPLAATPAMEAAFANEPAMAERVLGRNPLGRLGDATDDIGPVARFLLGPESRFVTGNTLMADGASCPIT
ncbi:SDR family NAD(P)-dependent oxidoreductase [Rhabdothermincola salaria]|uniref:SDR family NAD(P)-dependent oxidoreductase n=1 Tax=Rhabdothermincola salaria TaxID=2903142 RepID=UPI001E5827DA|nr:SDR family oxidoreductase [Rhabdothermincola salaria]MCD9622955.1 SDR family oxidoreductase [Rhabdothermincola salaria]